MGQDDRTSFQEQALRQKSSCCLVESGQPLHCVWCWQKKESHMSASDVKAAGMTILRSSSTPCLLMSAAVSLLSPTGCLVPDQCCELHVVWALPSWHIMLRTHVTCSQSRVWGWKEVMEVAVSSSWSCYVALVRATCLDDICHIKPSLTGTHMWMDPQAKLSTFLIQLNE